MRRPCDGTWLVPSQPAPARIDILLIGHASCDCEKLIQVDGIAQLVNLYNRPRVILLDARPQRLTG